MATVTQKYQTLFDLAQETDRSGRLLSIVEMMAQVNAIVKDMPFIPCNSGLYHKAVIRSGIPAGVCRKLYGGVPVERSHKIPVTDTTCILESYSEVDKAVAVRSGNSDIYRLREAKAFIEGMSQSMARILFYGDLNERPEEINGLCQRYGAYGTNKDESSYNVINGGGSTADRQCSIWLFNWAEDFVTGIYPTGANTKIGVTHEPLGQHTRTYTDSDDGMEKNYEVLRDHFIAEFGVHVADWRRVVRIANIDTSKFGSSGAPDLMALMRKATYRIPGATTKNTTGRLVWYMNGDVMEELERQYFATTQMQLVPENAAGEVLAKYRNIPIGLVEQLKNDEAVVGAAA